MYRALGPAPAAAPTPFPPIADGPGPWPRRTLLTTATAALAGVLVVGRAGDTASAERWARNAFPSSGLHPAADLYPAA